MISTPGNLRQFAATAHKQERFCWRMSLKKLGTFIRFQRGAIEHRKVAESIEDFLQEGNDNVERR